MPIKAVIFDLDGTITQPFFDFDMIQAQIGLTRRVTLLLFILYIAFVPVQLCAQEATLRDSGTNEQVSVMLNIDRKVLAPGESFDVWATIKVLCKKTLRFPGSGYYEAVLTKLYFRTPDGEVFVYWPYREPQESLRPLQGREFEQSLSTGQSTLILKTTVPMVNPSPCWLTAATMKPAEPNFRAVGKYEMWVEYRIPKIDGAPDDAWFGQARSPTIGFVVSEVPLADRRKEPTAEQLADIETMMTNKRDSMASLHRLEVALNETENEGLAVYITEFLRKQQREDDNKYPLWWNNLYVLVSNRAYNSDTLGITGPYLKDFAEISMTALEHRMAESSTEEKPWGTQISVNIGFLILYSQMEGKESAALKKRLGELALRHAKIPLSGKIPQNYPDLGVHKLACYKLGASWMILLGLGILYDGMPLTKATEILGEPKRYDNFVNWYYNSRMHVNPGLDGEISQGTDSETIVFKYRWK